MPPAGRLLTEGIDDAHVIRNLLLHHGWDARTLAIEGRGIPESHQVVIEPKGNDRRLLDSMEPTIRVADYPIGIVIDADEPERRWRQIVERFRRVHIEVPLEPVRGGFTTRYSQGKLDIPVGLWLMPDNRSAGAIERFLSALLAEGDPTFRHARTSTQALIDDGHAKFTAGRQPKAELRAYLAWQDEPGCSLGLAISKRYLDPELPLGREFAEWFNRVFGPPPLDRSDSEGDGRPPGS